MARPTALPRWANVGGDIVEPPSAKKDTGWVSAERPPAQFFNFLLNLIYQWLAYLTIPDGTVISAIEGQRGPGSDECVFNSSQWESATTGGDQFVYFTIPLRVGETLTTLTMYGREGNAAGEVYAGRIFEVSTVGVATAKSTTKTSGFTGVDTTLVWTTGDTDFPLTAVANKFYMLEVRLAQTSVAKEVTFTMATIA